MIKKKTDLSKKIKYKINLLELNLIQPHTMRRELNHIQPFSVERASLLPVFLKTIFLCLEKSKENMCKHT